MSSDPSLGWVAIDWIEHYLVHGPGDVQGQRVELDDEFAAFIVKAYRVDPQTGERRVRRAFLSRAKGRSKSGLAAMIECFEALGPARFDHWAELGEVSEWGYQYEAGEPVGAPLIYVEALNVATEEDQAGNTYDAVYFMLSPDTCSPELLEDYGRIDVGLTRINLPGKRGFIEPVTSADRSKDGGKSTFIVADETHLWVLDRLKRLHGVMTRNLLKRKAASGWMLETSTMYAAGEESVAEGTHAFSRTATGKARASLLFDHRQASDSWDLDRRSERMKALAEAYGPAAAWMNLEAICDSWDDPQVSHAEFRRYWLNQPVALVESGVVTASQWRDDTDVDSTIVTTPRFALDVSPSHSWAAIGVAGYRSDGRAHVEVTGKGKVSDHRSGTEWIVERAVELTAAHRGMVLTIAASSAAESMVPYLERAGVTVEVLKSPDVASACGLFYDLATTARLRHVGQVELTNALMAARRNNDDGELAWRWGRKRSAADITPLYAVTLALWAASQTPDPAVRVFSFDDLDMCDRCGRRPHDDPDGEHGYLCESCRTEEVS